MSRPEDGGVAPPARLEVTLEDGRSLVHELTLDQTNLGRGDQCELQLDDGNVSRLHAVVSRRADGYWVTDLGSLNGIRVNDVQVESAPLKDGDRVALGSTRIVFRQPEVAAAAPPPAAAPAPSAGAARPAASWMPFVLAAFVLGALVAGVALYLGMRASAPTPEMIAMEAARRAGVPAGAEAPAARSAAEEAARIAAEVAGEPGPDAGAERLAREAAMQAEAARREEEAAAADAAARAAAEQAAADGAAAERSAAEQAAAEGAAAERAAAERVAAERAAAERAAAEQAAAQRAATERGAAEQAAAERAAAERAAAERAAAARAAADGAAAERMAAEKAAAEKAAAEKAAADRVTAERAAAERAAAEKAAAEKPAAEKAAAERAAAEKAAAGKAAAEKAAAEKAAAEKAAAEKAAAEKAAAQKAAAAKPVTAPARDAATAGSLTGRQIMDEQERRHAVDAEYIESVMVLVDETGAKERRIMKNYTKDVGNDLDRSLIVFLEPAKVRGTALLTWEQDGRDDDQWLYLPSQKKLQRIAQGSKRSYFMGTDFTYEDNQSEQLDDYQYTVQRDDSFEGQPVWVVESIPVSPKKKQESGYSKRIVWIRKDIYFTVKIEYFDRRGRAIKTQTNHKLVNVGGQAWRPDQTLMDNYDRNHKTLRGTQSRKINPTIEDSVFTEQYIKAERHLD